MKILHITTRSDFGGIGHMIANFCNRPPSSSPIEQELAITPNGPAMAMYQSLGIKTHALHSKRRKSLRLVPELRRILDRAAPDIVHAHDPKTGFIAALALWRRPSIRLVYHIHMAPTWRRTFSLVDIANRIVLRRASLVICCADYLADEIIARFPSSRDRVTTIYNAINTARFDSEDSPNAGPGEHLTLMTCTRLVAGKGLEELVHSMPPIVATHPQTRLTLVGDGPLRSKLKTLAASLDIERNITFQGLSDDVPKALRSCDIYVYPSLSEGQPLGLLEAMSMGKAVVATAIPGIQEIITDHEHGVTIPPNNPPALAHAISQLIDEPERRQQMGQRARTHVQQHHSLARLHEQVDRAYAKASASCS